MEERNRESRDVRKSNFSFERLSDLEQYLAQATAEEMQENMYTLADSYDTFHKRLAGGVDMDEKQRLSRIRSVIRAISAPKKAEAGMIWRFNEINTDAQFHALDTESPAKFLEFLSGEFILTPDFIDPMREHLKRLDQQNPDGSGY